MGVIRVVLCVSLLLVPVGVQAAIPPAALNAFHSGQFAKSSRLAETEASAPSLAFAARALIADAISRNDGFCTPCLVQAETLAERAIALDPNLVEGHLQRAVAMGFRGRAIGIIDAQSEHLAEKAHDSLTKALELDPANIWALASLGAWHLEIVHHAGPILAEITYTASRSRGLTLFREALARDPSNAILRVHFALSILALDQVSFRNEAQSALAAALKVPTNDAFTIFMQSQARQLNRALQSDDPERLATLVHRLQGYVE